MAGCDSWHGCGGYAEIEKLLVAIFVHSKFQSYIYRKPVTVETDHQPAVTILKKPIHAALVRLQRMFLRLQKYNITLRMENQCIWPTLSRTHSSSTIQQAEEEDTFDVMTINSISSSHLEKLRRHTANDNCHGSGSF